MQSNSDGRDLGVLLVAAGVGVSAWALFPSTVESGIYVPLPDEPTTAAVGQQDAVAPHRFVQAQRAQLMQKTSRPSATAVLRVQTAAYPNLVNAVSSVPVKAKLQALLSLLHSETDLAKRKVMRAKLQALLELPEDVLLEVLAHPDLAEFNTMLDAVFLGDTGLWWMESQLAKIDVVPVTTTVDRIYVGGRPAFTFDSTAAAHGARNDGSSTPGLKSLPSRPTAPSEPQVSPMSVARSMPESDVSTFVEPAPSEQASAFSINASEVNVMQAAPSPDQTPPPAPSPAPPPPETNLELSQAHVETAKTLTSDVFDTGNRFEPGSSVDSTPTSNYTSPNETEATPAPPSTSASPPAADEGTTGSTTTPGGNEDQGGPPAGEPSP